MDNTDEFVGSAFGNLTVTGWDGTRVNGSKQYTLQCSECSRDTELFGDGLFYSTKHMLKQGKVPCGCATNPRWSSAQYSIRVKRVLSKQQVVIISHGEHSGSGTKLRLRCLIDNHEWESSYKNVLAGYGCRVCGNSLKVVDDAIKINAFRDSGKFVAGTEFWKSTNKDSSGKHKWYSACPVCSVDEYVQAGVCSGVFESSVTNLMRGGLPCRCSTKVKWTKAHREFQMAKSESPFRFIGWCNDPAKPHDCAEFMCETHGHFETTAGEFLNANRGCPKCVSHGFKNHLEAYLYVLKIQSESSEITGFGITNDITTRLSAHQRELGKAGLFITDQSVIKVSGKEAQQIEKTVTARFDCVDIGVDGFKREATLSDYQTVKKFVDSIQP